MTLDVTSFIDSKGGNAQEVRESQRKRGEPVELVDQVIDMYTEWVKSTSSSHPIDPVACPSPPVEDYEINGLNKQVNAIQKEIGAKKKVCTRTPTSRH